MTHTCKICNVICKNGFSFGKHLKYTHSINIEKYYYQYVGEPPICEICKLNKTKFQSFDTGYSKTCCRKCMGILNRKNLKMDKSKFDAFVDKVKINVTKEWALNDQTFRVSRMKKTLNDTISKMTKEEKIAKYGWMNKISQEEKDHYIRDVGIHKAMLLWWINSTEERKQECYSLQRLNRDKFYVNQPNQIQKELTGEEYASMCVFFDEIFGTDSLTIKTNNFISIDRNKSVLENFGII